MASSTSFLARIEREFSESPGTPLTLNSGTTGEYIGSVVTAQYQEENDGSGHPSGAPGASGTALGVPTLRSPVRSPARLSAPLPPLEDDGLGDLDDFDVDDLWEEMNRKAAGGSGSGGVGAGVGVGVGVVSGSGKENSSKAAVTVETVDREFVGQGDGGSVAVDNAHIPVETSENPDVYECNQDGVEDVVGNDDHHYLDDDENIIQHSETNGDDPYINYTNNDIADGKHNIAHHYDHGYGEQDGNDHANEYDENYDGDGDDGDDDDDEYFDVDEIDVGDGHAEDDSYNDQANSQPGHNMDYQSSHELNNIQQSPHAYTETATNKAAATTTPHGAMTSILSAADYQSPTTEKEQQEREQAAQSKENKENKERENIAKKALRLRATRYFNRGNSSNKKSNVKGDDKEGNKDDGLPTDSEPQSANAEIGPTVDDEAENDAVGVSTSADPQHDLGESDAAQHSPQPVAHEAQQHRIQPQAQHRGSHPNSRPLFTGSHPANHPPRIPNRPPNPLASTLSFFPRTTSPLHMQQHQHIQQQIMPKHNPHHSRQSKQMSPMHHKHQKRRSNQKMIHQIHQMQQLQPIYAMKSISKSTSIESNGTNDGNDDPGDDHSEVHSEVYTDYSSGCNSGSDLEAKARRILRGRRSPNPMRQSSKELSEKQHVPESPSSSQQPRDLQQPLDQPWKSSRKGQKEQKELKEQSRHSSSRRHRPSKEKLERKTGISLRSGKRTSELKIEGKKSHETGATNAERDEEGVVNDQGEGDGDMHVPNGDGRSMPTSTAADAPSSLHHSRSSHASTTNDYESGQYEHKANEQTYPQHFSIDRSKEGQGRRLGPLDHGTSEQQYRDERNQHYNEPIRNDQVYSEMGSNHDDCSDEGDEYYGEISNNNAGVFPSYSSYGERYPPPYNNNQYEQSYGPPPSMSYDYHNDDAADLGDDEYFSEAYEPDDIVSDGEWGGEPSRDFIQCTPPLIGGGTNGHDHRHYQETPTFDNRSNYNGKFDQSNPLMDRAKRVISPSSLDGVLGRFDPTDEELNQNFDHFYLKSEESIRNGTCWKEIPTSQGINQWKSTSPDEEISNDAVNDGEVVMRVDTFTSSNGDESVWKENIHVQSKQYMNPADIDFFTWNDDECVNGKENSVFDNANPSKVAPQHKEKKEDGAAQTETVEEDRLDDELQESTTDSPNVSREEEKPLLFSNGSPDKSSSHPRRKLPFSDGEQSDLGRDSADETRGRRLKVFRKKKEIARNCHSEGERSDDDWELEKQNVTESGEQSFFFGFSPLRRKSKKKKKYSLSPRGLHRFGERHAAKSNKVVDDGSPKMRYKKYKDGESGNEDSLHGDTSLQQQEHQKKDSRIESSSQNRRDPVTLNSSFADARMKNSSSKKQETSFTDLANRKKLNSSTLDDFLWSANTVTFDSSNVSAFNSTLGEANGDFSKPLVQNHSSMYANETSNESINQSLQMPLKDSMQSSGEAMDKLSLNRHELSFAELTNRKRPSEADKFESHWNNGSLNESANQSGIQTHQFETEKSLDVSSYSKPHFNKQNLSFAELVNRNRENEPKLDDFLKGKSGKFEASYASAFGSTLGEANADFSNPAAADGIKDRERHQNGDGPHKESIHTANSQVDTVNSPLGQTRISATINGVRVRSPAQETIIETEDEDKATSTVSGSQTDSLGSLLTKDNKLGTAGQTVKKSASKSDVSIGTGLSEIDRLRRENDLLRQELEKSSVISSVVQPFHGTKTNKTQLEALLDSENNAYRRRKDNQERIHRPSAMPRAVRLTKGADFDDVESTLGSITTHTPIVMDRGFGGDCDLLGGPQLIRKIATKTRSVAANIKTAANERDKSCDGPFSRSFECISSSVASCIKRDKPNGMDGQNGTAAAACASTVIETKAVIGRVIGCVKPSQTKSPDTKSKHFNHSGNTPSCQSSQTGSVSADLSLSTGHEPEKSHAVNKPDSILLNVK